MASNMPPVLIIGAGISGLTLAQACRKERIPFRIFDRDESPISRGAGWGLTLHWALPEFKALLPDDVLHRLPETYVNKAAVDRGEKGNFLLFDLRDGNPLWQVPAGVRIRVSREKLRKLMLTGLEVEWGKRVIKVTKDHSGVQAFFSEEISANGSFLVACDGAHSRIRKMIHGDKAQNYNLPVRFLGAGAKYTQSQIAAAKELDPYFFQGSDPKTDAFLWFSFLETPGDYGSLTNDRDGMYQCQIMVSWPYRKGFFGRADATDVPNTDVGRRSWMKALSAEWTEPFRSLVHDLPADCELKPVELADWIPQRNAHRVFDGRVALLGDAQHNMVMFRGEGANHAIVDVSKFMELIKPIYQATVPPPDLDRQLQDAVCKYESEVVERTELAVLASRQACIDANDFKRLNEKSPLLRRRLMKADLDELQT